MVGQPRPSSPVPRPSITTAGEAVPRGSLFAALQLYPAYRHIMARDPGLKVHLYGKGVRPGRKIGHVNVSGTDLDDLRERASHAADYLSGVITE